MSSAKTIIWAVIGTAAVLTTAYFTPEIADYVKIKVDAWKGKSKSEEQRANDVAEMLSHKFLLTPNDFGVNGIGTLKDENGYYVEVAAKAVTGDLRKQIPSVIQATRVKLVQRGQTRAQHYDLET